MYRHYDGALSFHGFMTGEERQKCNFFLVCFDENRIPGVKESYQKMRIMMKENGFRGISGGSMVPAPWYFIDIETKLFVVGRPGLNVKNPIGGHALTPDEFMTIYGIYKKYEDKALLKF